MKIDAEKGITSKEVSISAIARLTKKMFVTVRSLGFWKTTQMISEFPINDIIIISNIKLDSSTMVTLPLFSSSY